MSRRPIRKTNRNSTSTLLKAGLSWLFMIIASALAGEEAKAPHAKSATECVLVTPLNSKETVLVSPDGKEQHMWTSDYEAASGAHLLSDGSILRVADGDMARQFQGGGVRGGRVQRIAWNGEVIWDFWNAGTSSMVCGEALMLPNGNVLMATVERRDQEEVLKAGRDQDRVSARGLFLPGLLEVSPRGKDKGSIVWKWSAWDHVAQDRNPNLPNYDAKREQYRRLDLNAFSSSFGMASPRLAYDEASDLILITLPTIGELWLLDHGTTTKEAATEAGGKRQVGGGILWRWCPATVMPNSPRVISADFILQQDRRPDNLPSIAVLASHGLKSEKLMQKSVQQVTLKGMDLVPPQGRVAREILQQWEAPFETTYDLPNNLSIGNDPGSQLLSSTGIGTVNRLELRVSINELWRYHSLRGAAEKKVRVGYADTPCCGKTVEGKAPPDIRPLTLIRVSAIGTPRLYSASYVQAMLNALKVPATQASAK